MRLLFRVNKHIQFRMFNNCIVKMLIYFVNSKNILAVTKQCFIRTKQIVILVIQFVQNHPFLYFNKQ